MYRMVRCGCGGIWQSASMISIGGSEVADEVVLHTAFSFYIGEIQIYIAPVVLKE